MAYFLLIVDTPPNQYLYTAGSPREIIDVN